MTNIEKDDYVTISREKNPLTWRVVDLVEGRRFTTAVLESGQSGRRRRELLDDLTLHTKAADAHVRR